MELLHEPAHLRRLCDEVRARGERVGVVPTMGALHRGHLALVTAALERAEVVVVTVFVNPTQFGPNEDLDRYPRTLDADVEACREAGAHFVFAPERRAMYPLGEETRVRVDATAADLCGAHRPVHFEGVATVVTKLLSIVGPCVAVFGRKDYQQLRVIHRVVTDLFLPVEVVGVPTVREADGLALSSRNRYLREGERPRALALRTGLGAAWQAFAAGERSVRKLRALAAAPLSEVDRVDYVTLADPDSVRPLADDAQAGERLLVAMAAWVGQTRLIDNVVLGEDEHPHREGT